MLSDYGHGNGIYSQQMFPVYVGSTAHSRWWWCVVRALPPLRVWARAAQRITHIRQSPFQAVILLQAAKHS
jgi:hypothetical protein